MRQRLPSRLAFALLLPTALSLTALGSAPMRPALQTEEPSPTVFQRPVLTLVSYSVSNGQVSPGKTFKLSFRVANEGGSKGRNIVFTIVPGDFQPSGSGGVIAGGVIAPDADTGYSQKLIATNELALKSIGTLQIQTSYTDDLGNSYSETFNVSLPVVRQSSGSVSPTRTPTPSPRPILLIEAYSVDIDPLKPGTVFNLTIQVSNAGGSEARGVTLVIGGGTVNTGAEGTPGADGGSGVSGSGGSLENFAPLGESNVAYLDELDPAAMLASVHALIVNSTTLPGAYPLKLTLIYTDPSGKLYSDDHSITLLVYSPPLLEIGFYQTPDVLFVGQPGNLPVQVLNLDRKATVLSRVRVESAGAEMTNNELPIGYLDTGLSFTLDAQAVPLQPGPLEIMVSVDYVDDFNEPQVIQQALQVEVLEAEPVPEFPTDGLSPDFAAPPTETFWDKVMRFLRGLLGLDSALPGTVPQEEFPGEEPIQIVPGAPGTKG